MAATYILSIDAEATATDLDAWIPAVGVCLMDPSGGVVIKRRWAMLPVPGNDRVYDTAGVQFDPRIHHDLRQYFDSRTYSEFWARFIPVFLEFQADIKPAGDQWRDIAAFFDHIYTEYDKVVIVTDCPDFDMHAFNRNLFAHTHNTAGIRYSSATKQRHAVFNPNDIVKMSPHKTVYEKLASDQQAHDHRPENDAHNTAVVARCIMP